MVAVRRRLPMRKTIGRRTVRLKTKLGLPDLEQAKTAVLASLRSPESQRSYRHGIDEFVLWYCSEPRLSFNKTVVTRYRIHLEDRQLAPGTVNVRLAAVRRLAYEAADTGLLSPELAAGIRRVKGSKKLGMRLGNWLTVNEARSLWQIPETYTLKGKRDRAMLAVLLGCGLRRRELTELTLDHLQRREEHWAIVDLVGKGGHIRTIPVPNWVKQAIAIAYDGLNPMPPMFCYLKSYYNDVNRSYFEQLAREKSNARIRNHPSILAAHRAPDPRRLHKRNHG